MLVALSVNIVLLPVQRGVGLDDDALARDLSPVLRSSPASRVFRALAISGCTRSVRLAESRSAAILRASAWIS